MKMKLAALATFAVLLVPHAAEAHTGSVSCSDRGITFSYNADFPVDTPVVEWVNGVSREITVEAHTTRTDTIVAPSDHVTAYATRPGATVVQPTNLVCPSFTPPTCQGAPVVHDTVYVPGPETVKYIPYETTTYVDKIVTVTKVKYRTKVKWKVRTIIKKIYVDVPDDDKKIVKGTGVAG